MTVSNRQAVITWWLICCDSLSSYHLRHMFDTLVYLLQLDKLGACLCNVQFPCACGTLSVSPPRYVKKYNLLTFLAQILTFYILF